MYNKTWSASQACINWTHRKAQNYETNQYWFYYRSWKISRFHFLTTERKECKRLQNDSLVQVISSSSSVWPSQLLVHLKSLLHLFVGMAQTNPDVEPCSSQFGPDNVVGQSKHLRSMHCGSFSRHNCPTTETWNQAHKYMTSYVTTHNCASIQSSGYRCRNL